MTSLEISDSVRERVEKLRERSGADSLTEVLERALAVYDVVLFQAGKGKTLVLKDEKDGSEVDVLLMAGCPIYPPTPPEGADHQG